MSMAMELKEVVDEVDQVRTEWLLYKFGIMRVEQLKVQLVERLEGLLQVDSPAEDGMFVKEARCVCLIACSPRWVVHSSALSSRIIHDQQRAERAPRLHRPPTLSLDCLFDFAGAAGFLKRATSLRDELRKEAGSDRLLLAIGWCDRLVSHCARSGHRRVVVVVVVLSLSFLSDITSRDTKTPFVFIVFQVLRNRRPPSIPGAFRRQRCFLRHRRANDEGA